MSVTEQYPEMLPLPTFDGYAIEPGDGVSRTEMEAGSPRQRLRFTSMPSGIPVRWVFTPWEFALFEAWFKYRAKQGSVWFGIPLLGGIGMIEHEARFKGGTGKPYRVTPQRGNRFIVVSQLEVRERFVLTEEVMELALQEDMNGLISSINSANGFINSLAGAGGWN